MIDDDTDAEMHRQTICPPIGPHMARLKIAIVLHVVQAGLSPFLELTLIGRPVPLRSLVEDVHQQLQGRV